MTGREPSRVLVAGIGNIFLGDDGFGSEVVRRVLAEATVPGAHVVDYGIRGMHLAYDLLDGWDALVLVDAVPGRGAPGEVTVLEVTADDVPGAGLDAHAMDPAAVIANLEALGGTLPRTLLVTCQVADVADGIGLSPKVAAAVDGAAALVARLATELADDRVDGRVG